MHRQWFNGSVLGDAEIRNVLSKKFHTYDELKEAVCNYIDYYNNHRYQKGLNCMTPIEYRKHLACAV